MSDEPPYSRTREAAGLLFTAGVLGTDESGLAEDVGEQIALAFANLEALLDSRGRAGSDVVRLVVYLSDIDAIGLVNEAFTRHFAEPRPTRTTVEVSALPFGAAVELEATAAM
ncbi:MAG: RidA family protein [Microthrixaceae bacterium]